MDGQAEVGYQQGKQETWGHWEIQGRARMGSRGPEDRFHSFKRVLLRDLDPNSPPALKRIPSRECVWGFLFYPVFVAVAIAPRNPIIHQAGWGNQKIFKEGKKAKGEEKRLGDAGAGCEFSVAGWLLQAGSGSLVGEAGEIKGKEPSHKNRPLGTWKYGFWLPHWEDRRGISPDTQRQFKRLGSTR